MTYATYSTFGSSTDATVNGGSTTSHRFTGLTPDKKYFFWVVAKGGGSYLDSDSSRSVSATIKRKLRTPSIDRIVNQTTDRFQVYFNKVSSATNYTLYYSKSNGFSIGGAGVTAQSVPTANKNAGNMWIIGLDDNTTYYVAIAATDSTNTYLASDLSAKVSKRTNNGKKLATPTWGLAQFRKGSIRFKFNRVANASGYKVWYKKGVSSFSITDSNVQIVTLPSSASAITVPLSGGQRVALLMRATGSSDGYADSNISGYRRQQQLDRY